MITVAEKKIAWHNGMTVAELLEQIDASPPPAVVRVNETYISRPNFDRTEIPDRARIFLVPMVVGG